MMLAFHLSMPGVGSWNGKWSADGNCFCILKSFQGKARKAKATDILRAGHYSYDFGDGWRASVRVDAVGAQQSRKLRKASKGFAGYDWMVESILRDGAIYGPTQPKPATQAA